ncbi:hypothetical protein [Colwellia sp. E2M01]|uniref:hypothetical protein n=1 Tax=Colwellia sp. E2M01 TaxID=2841561 RepID=UPI001C0908B1|nr:hypothetical protein [Colwellia sp. E2M01]MBU2869877.1 hypothetical protein [Colwellia sp. E2M01]
MHFQYRSLDGAESEASFSDLKLILNGPIQIGDGWQSDRINLLKNRSTYIEFRSGPEGPPGIEPSEAVEVTKEYIYQIYGKKL